jgi:hypothetical protein
MFLDELVGSRESFFFTYYQLDTQVTIIPEKSQPRQLCYYLQHILATQRHNIHVGR